MANDIIPSGKSASLLGLTLQRNQISVQSQNIANVDTNGYKEQYLIENEMVFGGVTEQLHRKVTERGSLEMTNSQTSLAVVNGGGMLAVKDNNGQVFYAPTGNFPLNKDSILEMENGGYYLQGWRYDEETERYIKSLSNIEIKHDLRARPTDEVTVDLKLSGNSIAESDGGTFIVDMGDKISTELLLLDPKYQGTSFEIHRSKESDGKVKTQITEFTFGGFTKATHAAAATTISAAAPTGSLEVVIDGASLGQIAAADLVTPGATNDVVLYNLRERMMGLGLRCDIIDDQNGTDQHILIAPRDASSSLQLVETGNLLDTLGFDQTNILQSTDPKNRRFASISELSQLIEARSFDVWRGQENRAQFVVSAPKNSSISLYSDTSSGVSLMQALGITSSESQKNILLESDYDPYIADRAMANNHKVMPDLVSDFLIYDSLGNTHTMHASFMRLNGYDWAMEVYSANPNDIDGSTSNGLIQASRLTFDMNGNVANITRFAVSSYSDLSKISNPFQTIGATGDTFVISTPGNSETFIQGTDFLNMTDLVKRINENFADVTASIVNDASGDGYQLKITPINPQSAISTSGTAATALGIKPSAIAALPSLDKNLVIKWKGVSGADPEESVVDFTYDIDKITSTNSQMRCTMAENGYKSGALRDVEVTGGVVVGIYDNGQRINLYRVPLAVCNNVNGMRSVDNGLYRETAESGKVVMTESGAGGAGDIISRMVENSNVDLQNQLTSLTQSSQYYNANSVSLRTVMGLVKEIISVANSV